MFFGKLSNCTSMKIKWCIYNIGQVGHLSHNAADGKLLQLAEYHQKDRASTCIACLEDKDENPIIVSALRVALIGASAPSNENSRAQLKLTTLQVRGSLSERIENFIELIEICATLLNGYECSKPSVSASSSLSQLQAF